MKINICSLTLCKLPGDLSSLSPGQKYFNTGVFCGGGGRIRVIYGAFWEMEGGRGRRAAHSPSPVSPFLKTFIEKRIFRPYSLLEERFYYPLHLCAFMCL